MSVWALLFLCGGENSGVTSSHILTISLFLSFSRTRYADRVSVLLLCFSCSAAWSSAFFLALSLHVLWLYSPEPQTYLHPRALCPISSACHCMSPRVRGCLFCVVHWLLFCHYMHQIGGFVFYEDVCTGDWQVKRCNSSLAQSNMPDPLSPSAAPTLSF